MNLWLIIAVIHTQLKYIVKLEPTNVYNCDDQSLIHKIIYVYPKTRYGMFRSQKRCNETQISNDS